MKAHFTKQLLAVILTTVLLTAAFENLHGQTFPEPEEPARLVNDFTGILTPDEADALEIRLMTIFDSSSIHIVVVLVSDIGNKDISEYASGLFEAWGLGQIETSRGILLLIHARPPSGIRDAFIEPDNTLKGTLTEEISSSILKNDLIPNFRKGKRFTALLRTTNVLASLATGEYSTDWYKKTIGQEGSTRYLIRYLLAAIVVILFIRLWLKSRRK